MVFSLSRLRMFAPTNFILVMRFVMLQMEVVVCQIVLLLIIHYGMSVFVVSLFFML